MLRVLLPGVASLADAEAAPVIAIVCLLQPLIEMMVVVVVIVVVVAAAALVGGGGGSSSSSLAYLQRQGSIVFITSVHMLSAQATG